MRAIQGPKPKRRRTQAERRETTRTPILETTPDCLSPLCTRRLPINESVTITTGEDYTDDILKRRLKPVNSALQRSTYGNVRFTDKQKNRLRVVFRQSVCDYSRPAKLCLPVNRKAFQTEPTARRNDESTMLLATSIKETRA